jgi:long-chain acyl-CoA synthetase
MDPRRRTPERLEEIHRMKFQTLQAITKSIGERGDRLALLALSREGSVRWSYRSLSDHVRRLSAGLAASGVERGEPIAIFAPNRPEWIVAALAILDVRAVAVLIDAQARGDELAHYFRDSGARRVFTVREHADRLDELRLDPHPRVVVMNADDTDGRSWRRLLAAEPRELPHVEPGDRAALFYTAGTTGPPKGVPLTHENCASNLAALLEARVATPDDRILLPLPFHHVYPFMIGLMSVLATGAALVLPAGLTGPQIVRALREGEVTTIVGVPRFYEALVSGLEARVRARGRIASGVFRTVRAASIGARRALGLRAGRTLFRALHREMAPHVRMVASGGAKLDPGVGWKLEGLGWEVCTGYGLTETAPILTFNVPGESRLHTAGRPLRGVQLELDDPDGDGVGEVLARGPNVFAGYHNLPEKTAEAFTGDGWFRTGDLGRFDRDGYLQIVGRSSEILVLAEGKHVVPEDVEKVYLEHPAMREIGLLLHDGRLAALIVPDPGEIGRRNVAAEDVVREAVGERSRGLQSWQHISEYAITRESLPRTRLGKLKRHRLPELYERARRGAEKDAEARRPARPEELSDEDRALLEHPTAKLTWDWLVERYRDRRVTPDTSPQLELGIDSLEWMDLTLEMRERAGVELSEEAIAEIATVRDLLRATIDAAEAGPGPSGAAPLERPEELLSEEQRRWLEPSGAVVRSLGVAVHAGTSLLMRGLFHVRAEGLERVPARGQVVFAPNHRSLLDPFVIAAVLPRALLRQTFWGGATVWLFTNPFARLLSRIANVVPVDPRRAAISSLALGAAVLERRQNLVWFPEGRRSTTGELQRFLPGVGKLLERFKVPVVPVFIHGTEQALPPGRYLPRPARVTVVFGEPIHPDELARRGQGEDTAERITSALHDAVAELGRRGARPEERRRAA